MIRLFVGWDPREAIGFHAFVQSVLEKTSIPVEIIPLSGFQRDGTNSFTYARFLVPYLCNYHGWAIFADGSDMLLRSDLKELWDLRSVYPAISVVKHDYRTQSPVKYKGTELESVNRDYPRKNWSSLMLWDCSNACHQVLTPQFIANQTGEYLHRLSWIPDERIEELPKEWNWLDEYGENPEAKLIHYTTGIPGFYEYRNAPHADEWKDAVRKLTRGNL